jgi:hypothetical protein
MNGLWKQIFSRRCWQILVGVALLGLALGAVRSQVASMGAAPVVTARPLPAVDLPVVAETESALFALG